MARTVTKCVYIGSPPYIYDWLQFALYMDAVSGKCSSVYVWLLGSWLFDRIRIACVYVYICSDNTQMQYRFYAAINSKYGRRAEVKSRKCGVFAFTTWSNRYLRVLHKWRLQDHQFDVSFDAAIFVNALSTTFILFIIQWMIIVMDYVVKYFDCV